MHAKGVATNNELAANAFYNKYAPVRYSERRAFPDVKALEELFVETTLALLSSLPVRLAKTHRAYWYKYPVNQVQHYHGGTPIERLYRRPPGHCHSNQATIYM